MVARLGLLACGRTRDVALHKAENISEAEGDAVAHFMLRLVLCSSPDLRVWFVEAEQRLLAGLLEGLLEGGFEGRFEG